MNEIEISTILYYHVSVDFSCTPKIPQYLNRDLTEDHILPTELPILGLNVFCLSLTCPNYP